MALIRRISLESLTKWLLESFKGLKRWQIVMLAVVTLGSAWATYGVYSNTTSADQLDLSNNQQIIPVRFGDLVNQVSTNGTLTFSQRETLSFGSEGTVARLLVKEGQQVAQGQLLAQLDQASVIFLEESAAQARIDLQEAENSLVQLDLELALDLANAEEQVASAEFDLQTALEELATAQRPTKLLAQEELAANARLDLKAAQEELIDLKPGYAQQLAEALQTRADADLALEAATNALANYVPDLALRLAEAQQTKADADLAMEQARETLEIYKEANNKWLEVTLSDKETARQDLEDSQKKLAQLISTQERSPADYSSFISRHQTFVEIRHDTFQDLEARTAEFENRQARFTVAEKEAAQALKDLNILQDNSGETTLLDLEAAVEVAKSDLARGIKSLADLQIGVDPLEAALKQTQVNSAEASLTQAEEDLAKMLASANTLEITLREKQVVVAQAGLAKAQKELAFLTQDRQQFPLALRQSQVASAQQQLEDALKLLVDSKLKSPVSGLVALVNVVEGEDVQAGTTIVEIVDTSSVEIDGIVDEVDVLLVSEGIPTEVTFDALPGQVFAGFVSEISPAADSQQGVVTYPIKIQVDLPATLLLREGLTAVAKIILSEEKDVLMVPQQSLYGSFDRPTVRVMTDSGVVERPVELGDSDDFWVAVHQGLEEGEQVLMESAEVTTTGSGFRQLRGITGGRRGGRGR